MPLETMPDLIIVPAEILKLRPLEKELPAGDYTLQVTKTGYADLLNYKITVNTDQSTQGDVQIEKLPAAYFIRFIYS